MKLRSLSAITAVIFLFTASIAVADSAPSITRLSHLSAALLQSTPFDFEGDGLPDNLDPDDDNDGVSDDVDFAPRDPGVQVQPADPVNPVKPGGSGNQAPPPAPVDPIASNLDSDGDGIPNDLDPDDTNNAVTDEDEPIIEEASTATVEPNPPTATETSTVVPTVPLAEAPTIESTVVPQESVVVPDSQVAAAPVPVVNSLPSTGSGVDSALPSIVIVLIAAIGLVAVRARSSQTPKQ